MPEHRFSASIDNYAADDGAIISHPEGKESGKDRRNKKTRFRKITFSPSSVSQQTLVEKSSRIGHLNTVDLQLSHRDPYLSSGVVFPSESDTFLEELLFQDLDSNHNEDVTSVIQSNKNIFVNSTRRNVFEQCSELSELYPSSSDRCGAILKEIPLHFIESSHFENASAAVTVFGFLLKIFRSHCSSSLLAMIYNEIEMIECHMKICICLIHLFQNKAHSYLVKEDGHVYNFFTVTGYKSVVERIILQLIDVVYSVSLTFIYLNLMVSRAKYVVTVEK